MSRTLQPLGDRIIVSPIKPPKRSPGGVHLPDNAADGDTVFGTIVSYSEEIEGKALSNGQIVLFNRYNATAVTDGEETFYIVPYEHLLAKRV